jgi:hypothetical protein
MPELLDKHPALGNDHAEPSALASSLRRRRVWTCSKRRPAARRLQPALRGGHQSGASAELRHSAPPFRISIHLLFNSFPLSITAQFGNNALGLTVSLTALGNIEFLIDAKQ